ncbi:MAG: UDP-3-O-(3-hydroxymyristoyl)glucosamine N-acyltransferase [Alphaproteobacteria bacterium]|nr:UDP-3-O-(3-hydroxymyristoyl)glucosamine N-acyltransferase [Alphaproteobacteria bacterium]
MVDSRFHPAGEPQSLGRLAAAIGGELADAADADWPVASVAALDSATERDLSFISEPKYRKNLTASRAGAVILRPEDRDFAPADCRLVFSELPYRSFALAGQILFPPPRAPVGIHPTAVIDPSASLGADCSVGAGVVIGRWVKIGANCQIGANSVIGDQVEIGDDCEIGALVCLSTCLLGNRIKLQPGVRIGQAGFGFIMDQGRAIPLLQLGRVIVEDGVEIGANSTIDRGANDDTRIGAGTMIDNLVQIGHNVVLGLGCVISSQVGISGTVTVGPGVRMGGQVGIRDHVSIGDGATLAARAGVMTSVGAGETFAGTPAMPIKEHFRQVATLKQIAKRRPPQG